MSTEKSTPDDDTQVVDAVDETETTDMVDQTLPIDGTEKADAADETLPVAALDESEKADVVDQTQPIAALDEAQLPRADESSSYADTAKDADPLHLFAGAPEQEQPAAAQYASEPYTPAQAAPAPTIVVDASPVAAEPEQRRLRVGTVVWGLVLAACGLGVIAWASGARIDFQLALIVLLAVAGTALLVGSIVSGARHARR